MKKLLTVGIRFGLVMLVLCGNELRATIINPATVSGMQLRLDASTITGLTNGQSVSTWLDTSGAGNNATQASFPTLRPTYQTSAFNGRPSVRFTPNNWLNDTAYVAGAQTWFVVYKETAPVSSGTFQGILSLYSGTRASDILLMNIGGYQNITVGMDYPLSLGSSVGFSPTFDTTGHVLAMTYDGSGSSTVGAYTFGYDTNSQTALASANFNHPVTTTGVIGARSTGSASAYNGDIAEIIVYNSVLSAGDYAGIQQYLEDKWFVPEPSTAMLLGLGGLLLWRRVRQDRHV